MKDKNLKILAILSWIISGIGAYYFQHEVRHQSTAELWLVILSIIMVLGGLSAGTYFYPGGKSEYWRKEDAKNN